MDHDTQSQGCELQRYVLLLQECQSNLDSLSTSIPRSRLTCE